MNNSIKCLVLLIMFFPKITLADTPDNAICVIKHYQEYTNSLVSLYDAINQKLKTDHPKEYELLKPCNDVIIFDAKFSQSVVDKLWERNPERLFKFSKKLRNFGSRYDRNKVLKVKQHLCDSKHDSVTREQWDDAFSIQWQIKKELKFLHERYLSLEKLKWPDIKCNER